MAITNLLSRLVTSTRYIFGVACGHAEPRMNILGTHVHFSTCNPASNSNKGSDNGGQCQFDEEGFDLTTLKEEEKERLQAMKEHLAKNDYYEKYKSKIVEAQRSKPQFFGVKAEKFGYKRGKEINQKTNNLKKAELNSNGLKGILNVELVETLDKDDIVFVWKAYNEKRGKIGDSMPGTVYERVASIAATYNMFVFPLSRSSGYEFFLCQFSNNVFHFTPLASYQAHGENSPVSLILANYTELQFSKDLVLIMAEYNNKLVSPSDISNIYTQILFYYAYPDDKRFSLLKKFSESPSKFNHMDLIEEYENLNKVNPMKS